LEQEARCRELDLQDRAPWPGPLVLQDLEGHGTTVRDPFHLPSTPMSRRARPPDGARDRVEWRRLASLLFFGGAAREHEESDERAAHHQGGNEIPCQEEHRIGIHQPLQSIARVDACYTWRKWRECADRLRSSPDAGSEASI